MNLTYKVFFYCWCFFLSFFIQSCNEYPKAVKESLSKMGETNKKKFVAIFDHYKAPKDSLKLKACYFLVENMNDLGYYEGKQLRDYNVVFDILENKPNDYRVNLPWYSNELVELFDSLNSIYGKLSFNNFHFVKDVDAFTTESFTQNIDEAFEAWENPWSKQNVNFNDFCNYVLPYRNFNEPLENWRKLFAKEYQWIYDSVSENSDIIEVAKILNKDSELKYSNGFGNYVVSISPSNLIKAKYGACADNSNYKAMIMRAFGIPVAIDFLPQYGNDHNMHYWNSIIDRNGNFISFEEALNDINAFVAYKYRICKVYRKTFIKNKTLEKLVNETKGDIPETFKTTNFVDVTKEYIPVTNVKLQLCNIPENTKYIYIGVFNDKAWNPIANAEIINNKYAEFKDLGREIMYLPIYHINGEIKAASLPFTISKKGYIKYLEPKDEKETIHLTRKYHLHNKKVNWLKCLHNGIFEGANNNDFSDAKQLARIKNIPGEHYVEVNTNCNEKFKYLRFKFSSDELNLSYDGDGASIAEIEFISPSGQVIKGKFIGSPGRKYNPYAPELCFDKNPLTFFEDARPNSINKFVGLELETPSVVSKIKFLARNDMNSIQFGNKYELFYWNNLSFVSLSKKVANDTIIEFQDVPKNAILWLRNLTTGNEERIFTYEEEHQIWW